MKVNNPFKAVFALSLIVTIIGAYIKIEHVFDSQAVLIIGLLLTLAYIVMGIIEVNNSTKIDRGEKNMWTVGFIFFGFITAIVYLWSGQRRIVPSQR